MIYQIQLAAKDIQLVGDALAAHLKQVNSLLVNIQEQVTAQEQMAAQMTAKPNGKPGEIRT